MGRRPAPSNVRLLRVGALILVVLGVSVAVSLGRPADGGLEEGRIDRVFGPAPSSPTAREGQSRLWSIGDSWWAVLFERTTASYRIARLDSRRTRWVDTGVPVDERDTAQLDVLWNGKHLHVVSSGSDPSERRHGARALRFSYDASTERFRLDPGYPVQITTGGAKAMSLAEDDAGTLWITYTEGRRVRVAHSLPQTHRWSAPFDLPVPRAGGLLRQDQSVAVSLDEGVGVMWSDQTAGRSAYRLAVHRSGDPPDRWSVSVANAGTKQVDNHISAVGLPAGDPAGRAVALVKTSLTGPDDPLYYLLVLGRDGRWTRSTVWRAGDAVSRARISLDVQERRIYAYAVTPCCSGGSITYKRSDLDRISFVPGRGRLLIAGDGLRANNPTSSKQLITKRSGFVVLAADEEGSRYLFAVK